MEVTTRTTLLRADNIYRFYRAGDEETLAVQGVTLELHAGEVVVLSGPSGSGKSTLLNCLSGMDEPSGGTVWIDGVRMSGRSEAARAVLRARYVGTMAQAGNLLEHLTVRDNVRLARRLGGGRGSIDELLTDLALNTRARAWPDELSGGELVRGALAVALANAPAVLLADEPTGELDEATEARVLNLIRRRAEAGCAVLIASHSAPVRDFADRSLDLADGRLVS